jgi:succinate dehydrogenase/fumarate reductase-like Fe-S protein
LTIKSTSHTTRRYFLCAYIHLCLFVCPSNIQLSKID